MWVSVVVDGQGESAVGVVVEGDDNVRRRAVADYVGEFFLEYAEQLAGFLDGVVGGESRLYEFGLEAFAVGADEAGVVGYYFRERLMVELGRHESVGNGPDGAPEAFGHGHAVG